MKNVLLKSFIFQILSSNFRDGFLTDFVSQSATNASSSLLRLLATKSSTNKTSQLPLLLQELNAQLLSLNSDAVVASLVARLTKQHSKKVVQTSETKMETDQTLDAAQVIEKGKLFECKIRSFLGPLH